MRLFAFKEISHSILFSKKNDVKLISKKRRLKLCDEQVDTIGDPFVTIVVTIHSRTIEQTD